MNIVLKPIHPQVVVVFGASSGIGRLYAATHPARELIGGGAGKAILLLERLAPRLAERRVFDDRMAVDKNV